MDIASGAERDAESLLADLDASIARLEQTWSVTTDTAWQGRGLTLRGEVSTLALPFRRWVEVEVHHVDLGLGYSFEQLPSDFVGLELRNLSASWASRQPMGLTDLPDAARRLAPHDRLAWLLGRLEINGLAPAGVYG